MDGSPASTTLDAELLGAGAVAGAPSIATRLDLSVFDDSISFAGIP